MPRCARKSLRGAATSVDAVFAAIMAQRRRKPLAASTFKGMDLPDTTPAYAVMLQPQGWRFDAPAGTALLKAAAAAGIVLPSSCRNGTCRTCMCRATTGSVTYAIEWPGLTREEKAEGLILPCVARAASDLVLDQPLARK